MIFSFKKRWCDECKQMQPPGHEHGRVVAGDVTKSRLPGDSPPARFFKDWGRGPRQAYVKDNFNSLYGKVPQHKFDPPRAGDITGTCNACGHSVVNRCPSHPFETLNSVRPVTQ